MIKVIFIEDVFGSNGIVYWKGMREGEGIRVRNLLLWIIYMGIDWLFIMF